MPMTNFVAEVAGSFPPRKTEPEATAAWIDNELSQRCHEALGFKVVDRCVHYRKALQSRA